MSALNRIGIVRCETCYFFQHSECALSRSKYLCGFHQQAIPGITEIKTYIDLVNGRRNGVRALAISILSLAISAITLALKLAEVAQPKVGS